MDKCKKRIVVIGSTGSIGRQTLEVLDSLSEEFSVIGLTAGNNIDLLNEQIDRFMPEVVCISKESDVDKLSVGNRGRLPEIFFGDKGLQQIAGLNEADIIVSAISGAAGLLPTYTAIKNGKNIALANKETLVAAGRLITDLAYQKKAMILPVDSEHSAIFQCLQGQQQRMVNKIILTASGGPFRQYSRQQLEDVSVQQALKHPSWQMGRKITVDSATMVNKALELIEAKWLFDVWFDNIEVVVHPQSIIHSLVEFKDGVQFAQLGMPDMRIPIQYALTWPRLRENNFPKLDLTKVGHLDFEQPDTEKFPGLKLGFAAGKAGKTYPAVMNAANEVAVNEFLNNKIKFLDITRIVEQVMDEHQPMDEMKLDNILLSDSWARQQALRVCEKIAMNG